MTPAGRYSGKGGITVVDISGKQIAAFNAERRISWNGLDRRGQALAPGIYFLRWQVEGKTAAQQKLIVLQ